MNKSGEKERNRVAIEAHPDGIRALETEISSTWTPSAADLSAPRVTLLRSIPPDER